MMETQQVRLSVVPFGTTGVSIVIRAPNEADGAQERGDVQRLDGSTAQTRLVSAPKPSDMIRS